MALFDLVYFDGNLGAFVKLRGVDSLCNPAQ
jgi:hypothetical protein